MLLHQELSAIGNQKGEDHASAERTQKRNEGRRIGPIYVLDNFTANFYGQGGKRYTVGMELELRDPKAEEEITRRLPQVRDCILMILPARKAADVQSADGKNALRSEIRTKLNELIGKEIVEQVYFTEFVIRGG